MSVSDPALLKCGRRWVRGSLDESWCLGRGSQVQEGECPGFRLFPGELLALGRERQDQFGERRDRFVRTWIREGRGPKLRRPPGPGSRGESRRFAPGRGGRRRCGHSASAPGDKKPPLATRRAPSPGPRDLPGPAALAKGLEPGSSSSALESSRPGRVAPGRQHLGATSTENQEGWRAVLPASSRRAWPSGCRSRPGPSPRPATRPDRSGSCAGLEVASGEIDRGIVSVPPGIFPGEEHGRNRVEPDAVPARVGDERGHGIGVLFMSDHDQRIAHVPDGLGPPRHFPVAASAPRGCTRGRSPGWESPGESP